VLSEERQVKGYEKLRFLFSGWDSVEVAHHEGPCVTVVRLTVTDQNLHANMARNLRALPLSSRSAEELLRHKPGQMRFYGRGVRSDKRYK
jgi:hypothetical protein